MDVQAAGDTQKNEPSEVHTIAKEGEMDVQIAGDTQRTEQSDVRTVANEAQWTNGPRMIDVLLDDVCRQAANPIPSRDQDLLAKMQEKPLHTLCE